MTTLRGNWNYPTAIRFGAGRIAELPDACRTLDIKRPLLVTDPVLAAMPMIASAVAACRSAGLACEVFSDVQANPIEANVTNGVAAYRSGGHDGVIAFGGGSALDTGKAIALMVGQTRPIWDFEDREDWFTRVNVAGMAKTIGVPTTSGTGSEVGRASVLTDLRDHSKKIIFHPKMQPALVIADPELTLGLAAARNRRCRHGRPLAQHRGVLCALLPSDRGRRRSGRHAADQGVAARRGQGRRRTSRRVRT